MNHFDLKAHGLDVSQIHLRRCAAAAVLTLAGTLVCLAVGLLGGGCASSSGTASAPRPQAGRGVAEYRQLASEAHRAVFIVMNSMEALSHPAPSGSAVHPALAGFDRAFLQLEVTSVTARARAEAIIARGQAYFDEWKTQLSTNQFTAQAEQNRYARLLDHFDRVRQRSGEVRAEFRPFMTELREFRARMDRSPRVLDEEAARKELDGLITKGRQVLQTLTSVLTALHGAEAELQKTEMAKQ